MVRKLENWFDAFMSFTEQVAAPEMFKKWAAISTLACVMERRFWVDVGLGPLYPNIYAFLVAPPGAGKTVMTSLARSMLKQLSTGDDKGLRVAQSSLTSASVIDELRDSTRRVYPNNNLIESENFNAMAVISNELGVFLPSYDHTMMNNLTDIYDGQGYSERRRWAKKTDDEKGMNIDKPLINLLASTTPGYLTTMLPEGAWDMGFLSRTILVFSGERSVRPIFAFHANGTAAQKDVMDDLKHIFNLPGGELKFTKEAEEAIKNWHAAGGPPIPDHPRLQNYNSRRTAHMLKLAMVACIAEGDKLTITVAHFLRALEWLLEAEELMPDIFKAMVHGGDMKAIEECWYYTYKLFMKDRSRPVAEQRIITFLQERVPAQNVMRVLEVMVKSRILEEVLVAEVGKAYKPRPPKGA